MRSYKNATLLRTDHRKANPASVTHRDRVRDSKNFKTVEQQHDPEGRFARSIKCNYIDSDADGYKDMYVRKYRSASVSKPDYRELGTGGFDADADSPTVPSETFDTATLTDSSNLASNDNIFTFTIQPSASISAGSSITLSGLTGSATTDGSVTLSGAGAPIFGSAGSWTQSTGTLVLTVDTAQTLPTGSNTVVTFTLTNSASSSGVTSVNLSSSEFTTASISGLFLEALDNLFSLALLDTEANIRASTTPLTGDTAYGTDTEDFYVFDGTNWQIYNNL